MRESRYGRGQGFRDGRDERRAVVMSLNDRIAAAAVRHHFEGAGVRVPFQCECGAADCRDFVLYSVGDYNARREDQRLLVAPSHAD